MNLLDQLHKAFPDEPVDSDFFAKGVGPNSGDIAGELYSRLYGRKWTEVTMDDWTRIGPVQTFPYFLSPRAVHYYVPSLLTASLNELDYLELGVEALLPNNQKREPRGEWWKRYFDLFDQDQTSAIRDYLSFAKKNSVVGSELEHLASLALAEIWAKR